MHDVPLHGRTRPWVRRLWGGEHKRPVGSIAAVSSHESATFQGIGRHFCGRVARLATRQRPLHLSSLANLATEPCSKAVACMRYIVYRQVSQVL